MNIFITGAGGFIGRHLVKRLRNEHCLYTPDREFFHQTDDESLARFMNKKRIDAVIHLATHFVRKHTISDVAPLIDSNILLGTRILEALKERPETWFINTGTALQHTGPGYDRPFNLYAATKESFEMILQTYDNPHVTLKLFETYGAGDNRDKVINLVHRSAETREELRLSPGYQELELAHVDDVVAAYERILELMTDPGPIRNKSFAVPGTRVNLRELVKTYEATAGRSVPALWGSLPYRDNEVMIPWKSYERVPGLTPGISLEQGILKTFCLEKVS